MFQQIIAGTVDMQWGETTVPTPEIPALLAAEDDRLVIEGAGSINPYLAINTLSPNADGAFANPLVRQALNFAVDRQAVQQILGGPNLSDLAYHILPPEVPGSEDINPLNIPPNGDPDKARELLTEAGYPDGVPIKLLYTDEQEGRTLAALLEQMLGDSGFDVELVFAQRNAFYGDYLLNHEFTESGGWDIAPVSWYADYLAGRAYMVPMIDGRGYASGSPNYGGYNNDEVNSDIDAAIAASTPEEAATLWATGRPRWRRRTRRGCRSPSPRRRRCTATASAGSSSTPSFATATSATSGWRAERAADVSGRRQQQRLVGRHPADEALQVVHREHGVVDAEEQREIARPRRGRHAAPTTP